MEEILIRIRQLIVARGLTSNAFAVKAEINPSNFSKKTKGQISITKTDIDKICSAFGVNKEWLIDGKGDIYNDKGLEMIKKANISHLSELTTGEMRKVMEEEDKKKIPYFDIDFTCSVIEQYNDSSCTPKNFVVIPGIEKADFCCRTSGDSMTPYIMSGDLIAMKKVEDWNLFLPLNEVYGIVTKNGLRAIKVLKRGSDNEHFTLHSYNNEYEDQEIHKEAILAVFKVIASARMF